MTFHSQSSRWHFVCWDVADSAHVVRRMPSSYIQCDTCGVCFATCTGSQDERTWENRGDAVSDGHDASATAWRSISSRRFTQLPADSHVMQGCCGVFTCARLVHWFVCVLITSTTLFTWFTVWCDAMLRPAWNLTSRNNLSCLLFTSHKSFYLQSLIRIQYVDYSRSLVDHWTLEPGLHNA